ncbi:MAG: polysaccharide deacetylase family protein [Acidobacteriia bacterium]|nr:polysaccharide deacetylase family protein [Terriglobia bacterium]
MLLASGGTIIAAVHKFMRIKLLLALCAVSLFLCLIPGHTQQASPSVTGMADEVVGNYRRIIVLMEDDASIDAAKKDRITTLARMLFEQNLERLAGLHGGIGADRAQLDSFLDHLESSADYHDADKLAFRELLEDLAAELPKDAPDALKKRIADDIAALEQIQALYQKELGQVFDRIRTRGMPVRREAWERYLASIKTKYQRDQILKEYENLLPVEDTRGGGKKKRNPNVLDGSELPPKTLLLTFDDGPHARYTDAILEVLKKYQIHAVFFEVGNNIGSVGADGKVTLGRGAAASARILQSGSALGNHSYTHALLPKLDATGYTKEIDNTDRLLKEVLKSDPTIFRPPYGAQNDGILGVVEGSKMKSMVWNIDSMDWADPVPNSVAQRVLKQVAQHGRGVILFHDIHRRALDALPGLIENFQKQGYRFASWNGNGFQVSDARGVETVALPKPGAAAPYRESWAAVIGIDAYQKWPRLSYAAHDAAGIRDTLIQKYKFKPENVFVLLNEQATRENILSLLGDKLASPDMVKHEDRVFVFFAGHGATRKLPSGRDLGYIIPVDADLSNYQGQAISMSNFQDIAESIPAKHLLFVMDSCYSGLALTRGGGLGNSANYLQEIARRTARQMFTAGGSDEQVADNGPNGHSVFTWTLLQGLDGRADLNGDGVITASELATYVAPAVSSLSHQTPAFGNLAGSEGGDFIFELKHESEFLNADSAQLNDDGIRMNAEMEKLRQQNEKLQKQLADAQARLDQKAQSGGPVLTPGETSQYLNDQGMRLYKEKKYAEAAAKFNEAAAADPTNAQAVNNAGFAMYKLEKYADSIPLFLQTLKLDPVRAVAYINLGDAYVKLQKIPEAKAAYEKYLEMAPSSKSAPDVREKLRALNP